MEKSKIRPYVLIVGLVAFTSVLLVSMGELSLSHEASVSTELPSSLGEWKGQDVLFCQNVLCASEFRFGHTGETNLCAVCGSSLDRLSLAENRLLPDDTIVARKAYRNPRGVEMHVSVVVSGKERTSIHRPQMCLTAQGYHIERQQTMDVSLEGREPVRVAVLELRRKKTGSAPRRTTAYAYWFTAPGHETSSHWRRTFWMAYDNIVHGTARRWAYVAVSTARGDEHEEGVKRVGRFIRMLHPHITRRPSSHPVDTKEGLAADGSVL
jgi:EpsI family protein